MKSLLLTVCLFSLSLISFAQQTEKEIRAEIKSKALKEARKEAKKYKKQGYDVAPGSLPMEKMLEKTWYKLLEEDEKGELAYISADGNAVAETKTAADLQAFETAKLNLAGQLETIVRAIVESNIANAQLNVEEAASVTKVLTGAKNIIATKLERVDPVFKIYRIIGKNVETNVKIVYKKSTALNTAKQAIREELEKGTQELQQKLDKILQLQ
ncbi:MAG: hypothetical protein LC115_08820 [Bacteroidia bacterium]|nr:hypothetical protein [Bacteroidia bacterium]